MKPDLYDRKMAALRAILQQSEIKPRIVVETGTLHGQLSVRLPELFTVVHTIELSKELFDRHPEDNRVCWHCGDSRTWLRELHFDHPVLYFLDAHYFENYNGSRVQGVAGSHDFPLWDELDIISERNHADIVVVDDVHCFGKDKGEAYGNWQDVTPQSIAARYGKGRAIFDKQFGDMHAFWRSVD